LRVSREAIQYLGKQRTPAQALLAKELEKVSPEVILDLEKPIPIASSFYRIDIALPSQMIAIEVDGPSHYSRKNKEADLKRTNFLEQRGWRVLRFTNQEVLQSLPQVLQTIAQFLT
jgi:ATP-dependent DNA helicase RecQ